MQKRCFKINDLGIQIIDRKGINNGSVLSLILSLLTNHSSLLKPKNPLKENKLDQFVLNKIHEESFSS